MTTQTKNQLKDTLLLPKTRFPMRANLAEKEPQSLSRWARAPAPAPQPDGEPFVLHDGPPYANGDLHLGHLLNRCLKDFVVRSQRGLGRPATLTPGWDCHGLPIAQKVLPGMKGAEPDEQRAACRAYAGSQVHRQAAQMRRLLASADYGDPYRTMDPGFAAGALEVLAGLVERGFVTRRTRPVHWSPVHRSALAEAEVVHLERDDPSLYVRFRAQDAAATYAAFQAAPLPEAPSWVAWTTTPWSLPANLALAVHPDATYQLVLLGGAPHVLAKERVAAVAAVSGLSLGAVLGEAPGRALVGLRYRPLLAARPVDGAWRVQAAAHVLLTDGTGVVHTAPGHGVEDHRLGLALGLPALCPVDDRGRYTDEAPAELVGQDVWAAEPALLERLAEAGAVLHLGRVRHSYPHAERDKTPVLFRATPQWFVQLDAPGPDGRTLRAAALSALDAVQFHPPQRRNRLTSMVQGRPDWCVSRQRVWGLPLPAFFGPGGQPLLTAASVRAVAAVFEEDGTDAWYRDPPAALLRRYDPASDPERPGWLGDLSELACGADVLDVWFESGASWHAAHRRRGGAVPVDLYLEGSDQHRGWFQLSLLTAAGLTGAAPFRHVLTHGFVVDGMRRKLSKSRGVGTLTAPAVVERYGAEVCRWWVAGLNPANDVAVSAALLVDANRRYRRVRNTLRFLLGNLSAPRMPTEPVPPGSLDAWVRHELAVLSAAVRADYAAFLFARAASRLQRFCSHTLSAVYFRAVKDRLYCDRADSPRRVRVLETLTLLADALCRLLAPLLPHTADEAWRVLHGDSETVHRHRLPDVPDSAVDPGWAALFRARGGALAAVEAVLSDPLDAGVTLPDPGGAMAGLDPDDLADALGVSRVWLDPAAAAAAVVDLRDQPRCARSWKRHPTVARRRNGLMLSDRDAAVLGVP